MASGTDLSALLTRLHDSGPHKTLPTPRRIRVIFNKTLIVDTTRAVLVWEHEWYPQYYIPASEIRNASLTSDALAKLTVAEKAGVEAKSTDRVLRFDDDGSPSLKTDYMY